MPRWYSLCNGADIPSCAMCRRFAPNNPGAASEARQGWTQPELLGTHCNKFIERPVYATTAMTPSNPRG